MSKALDKSPMLYDFTLVSCLSFLGEPVRARMKVDVFDLTKGRGKILKL